MKQTLKNTMPFVTKATLVYGLLALGFSFLGVFLPERTFLDSPITGGLNVEHILGHIGWGLMIGALSYSLRYFLLAGSFAIIIDWDHLIQFLDIDAIGRMGHSIPFGFFSVIIMMLVFGKKDYMLGATAFAAMLAHISFDTLTGSGNFPLFAPFYDYLVRFPDSFWFIFQGIGAAIILTSTVLLKTKKSDFMKNDSKNHNE